jgi:hypothetical protein
MRKVRDLDWGAACLVVIGAGVVLSLGLSQRAVGAIIAGTVTGVLVLAAVGGSIALYAMRQRHYRHMFFRIAADKHLRAALRKDIRSNEALPELILFNRAEMARFECIAQTQAKSSHRAGLVAASVGLAALVGGVVLALTAPGADEKAAAAAVGVCSAAVSGFISHAFLATYRMAAQQMSFYYGQPLVNCFLLHAELLTNDFDSRYREDARAKVLSALLAAAARAQHQILILAGGRAAPEPAPKSGDAIADERSPNGQPGQRR